MTGYCNSPIIIETVGFTPGAKQYFPSVEIRLKYNGNAREEKLVAECNGPKLVRFDLSKYARGLLYNMPLHPTYDAPKINVSYTVWERYLYYLSEYPTQRNNENGNLDVYLGRGDVLKKFNGTEGTTYKPSDTEVVNDGDIYVPNGGTLAINVNRRLVMGADLSAIANNVYIEDNPLRHQLIFLNSFGRWESASALARESKQYDYSSKQIEIDTDFPDNVDRHRIITHKQSNGVTWQMSSGYCTSEWAEWWAEEVIAAENVWLHEGNKLVPVILQPEDSTGVWNKSNGELAHVDFKIRFI